MLSRIPPPFLSLLLSLVAALCLLIVATTAMAEPPPADAFFGAPEFHSARLSPNGEWIAVVHEKDGRQIIFVRPLRGGEPRAIAQFRDEKIRLQRFAWANDERLLLSGQFQWHGSPGEDTLATNLFGIDRDGRKLRNLGSRWPDHQSILLHDRIIHMLPEDPQHVLLTLRPANKDYDDVYRLNVDSGRLSRVVQGRRDIDTWHADHDGMVRVGTGTSGSKGKIVARVSQDTTFETIADFDALKDEPGWRFIGFTSDPNTLLVAARRSHADDLDGDRMAIFEYSLTKKEIGRLVFAHSEVDVAGPVLVDPSTDEIIGIRYWVEGEERHFLDAAKSRLQRSIDHALPDSVNTITDRTRDGRILLVRSVAPERAPRTRAWLRDEREIVEIFVERPGLEGTRLARPRSIRYTARDGAEIPGYLTLPVSGERGGLATVVMPHGDPHTRDTLRYDPLVQFLASRGYAVLQLNHRGTSGYGAAHRDAGLDGTGRTVANDIADGARWMISEGYADPDRIAVYGTQYGANAALMASAASPTLFRCAVGFSGVFDLTLEPRSVSPDAADPMLFGTGPGVSWNREQRKASSAIEDAGRIRVPVLLGHGEYDPVVAVNQSKRMARALRRSDRSVELIVYDDGHGAMREATALPFYADLDRFLAQNTGARANESPESVPASPMPR